MKRLALVSLVLSLLAVPVFADGKPHIKGDVYGLPTQGEHAGKAALFVIDRDLFSEYIFNAATNEVRLIAMARIATDQLANGERAIRFQGSDCTYMRGLENVALIVRDGEIELPDGGRIPRIRDLDAIPVETPAVIDRGEHRLRPATDASPECCGACFGVHIGLSIAFLTNMTIFDVACCGFGC